MTLAGSCAENRAEGDDMPSIRSESDLSSLAPPPTLRVTSLDLPALRYA